MSYIKIWIHAVWGTKNRMPLLRQPILEKVCAHIATNAKKKAFLLIELMVTTNIYMF
jgi:hypothetical protein